MKDSQKLNGNKEKSKGVLEFNIGGSLPQLHSKKSQEEFSGIMYLSGDQMKKIIAKDKKKKRSLVTDKRTRDISHLKDKLKKQKNIAPLQLPTNMNYLRALIDSPSSTGLSIGKKLSPLTCSHKGCVERLISSDSFSNLRSSDTHQSLFTMNSSPEQNIDILEREYLGSPSGYQEIECLME